MDPLTLWTLAGFVGLVAVALLGKRVCEIARRPLDAEEQKWQQSSMVGWRLAEQRWWQNDALRRRCEALEVEVTGLRAHVRRLEDARDLMPTPAPAKSAVEGVRPC